MYRKFKECTTFRFETFFWTDSRTVLQWLAKPPRTWNAYVANRVSFIQHITQGCHLFHVPGVMNPADQLSRGLDPKEFIDGDWDPLWMYETSSWPAQATPEEETEDCAKERRKHVESAAAVSAKSFNESYFAKFNEYWKLIRTTAYWRRYLRNRRLPEAERTLSVPLTTKELQEAEWCLARLVQQEAFSRELQDLSKGKPVHNTSKLRWFNPQLSKEGVIRVGGRLGNCDRNENFKHPIIIPGNHHFSKLLADCLHLRLFHAGTQLMLATMRQKFWPLRGRDLCRQTTHQCKDWFKAKPQLYSVDYFGPVYIRQGYRRGPVKAYVAVFVCFGTKAVHLELVSDLSTAKFLQALRRFVARRGKPADMHEKHHEHIQHECSQEGINWHFIPPGAPHFGGLWEAAVKSAKKHLLRVVGQSSISHEDYITLLAQVEACLNSRPLTPLTEDPSDLEPLTPAHFLIGTSLEAVPDKNYSEIPNNRLTHWQSIQQQLQHFWRRWHTEYLQQLQARVKNWQPAIEIRPGRLVIVVDENQPSMKWKMARIHEIHPGADGVVRVVTLRTATGYLKRPVTKICLLPIPAESIEEEKAETAEIGFDDNPTRRNTCNLVPTEDSDLY
ncbi:uncharacterized protein LOC119770569 [Culex quinquefasciatus]|uniref:uncharacterized protein LOC119770569 n=1 Tax=Culex quinquefasciatus TaxID=7176 RepID=UPI0018E35083|nr:uncharacterized protein LOC119770569 [Culex quinquefasciatus]